MSCGPRAESAKISSERAQDGVVLFWMGVRRGCKGWSHDEAVRNHGRAVEARPFVTLSPPTVCSSQTPVCN